MLKNYLKTAWRVLIKNRTFSVINILGLALGMGCSLLMMLWVKDELAKDTFHVNDARLFSVYERQIHDGQIDAGYYTPGPMAEEMKATLPEVEFATPFAWNDLNTFSANDKILKKDGNHGGPDFFQVFTYPLLEGDPATALKTAESIAISHKMANDFFGSPAEAIGKAIRYENRKDMKVTAVFEDIGSNSSTKFDFIINWETFLENNEWARQWGNFGPSTLVVLREGTDPLAFERKIEKFLDKYNTDQTEKLRTRLGMTQYSQIYLHGNFKNGEIVGGRIESVNLFSVVAVFILVIACINFMNLTTARSVKRAREIGVRKVVGAFRGALIRQFIGEAMFIVVLSFLLAMLLVWVALPLFNGITQKEIVLPLGESFFWVTVVCLTLGTGLLAGSYPAFYLSSFNPVGVLKGSLKFNASSLWFRKGLVVFQFILSIILVISTFVISQQVEYIQQAHLGYDRENLIYIPLEGDLTGKYAVLKNRALGISGISTVSRITQSPTSINNGTGGVEWEGKDPNSALQFVEAAIGYDFVKTMDLEMAAGRDYSKEFTTDSVGYIVNEKAASIFGYTDPIGMPLTFWGTKGTIVGVIKDFHFNSFHSPINPLVLRMGETGGYGWVLVRTEGGKTKEALAGLEALCRELNPNFPFTYKFSDDEYDQMYRSEQVVSTLSNGFAFLAIFISCLGLLGLAMFTAEQRTKEVGIRKVLGASIQSLFGLLSKEILVLVTIAIIIACPIAWYFMNDWLKDYAYRTDISLWIFLSAGILAIFIALVTISFQTIKTLLINPVNSLRSE